MTSEEFKLIELLSNVSIDRASQALSKSLKAGARIELVRLRKLDISAISEEFSVNDGEVSGAIVRLNGDASAKLIFMVENKNSLKLTDLFLRLAPGMTKELDEYVKSTIQEIGNILASSISNVFAKDLDIDIAPSPPEVLSDYSSCIFNTILADEELLNDDEIILIEAKFFIVRNEVDCALLLLPTIDLTKILCEKFKALSD